MNKKTITFALCLASATTLTAQNQPGGISSVMLQKIETSQKSSPAERALANAFASNNIDDLARNHAHQGALNTYFKTEHSEPGEFGPLLDVFRLECAAW